MFIGLKIISTSFKSGTPLTAITLKNKSEDEFRITAVGNRLLLLYWRDNPLLGLGFLWVLEEGEGKTSQRVVALSWRGSEEFREGTVEALMSPWLIRSRYHGGREQVRCQCCITPRHSLHGGLLAGPTPHLLSSTLAHWFLPTFWLAIPPALMTGLFSAYLHRPYLGDYSLKC